MQPISTKEDVAILLECAGKAEVQEVVIPFGSKLREVAVKASEICGIPLEEVILFDKDGEVELDLNILVDAGYPHHKIHHATKHKLIEVIVFWNGGKQEHKFHPTTKVEKVREWAVKAFGIDHGLGLKMELAIQGTKEELPRDASIGRFVHPKEHCLKLDLIEGVKPNG